MVAKFVAAVERLTPAGAEKGAFPLAATWHQGAPAREHRFTRARVGSHPGYVPEPAARAHDAGDGPPRAAPWVAGSGRSARARCSAFALRRSTFYSVPSTPGTPKGGTLGPIAQFTAPTRATTALAVYRENPPPPAPVEETEGAGASA